MRFSSREHESLPHKAATLWFGHGVITMEPNTEVRSPPRRRSPTPGYIDQEDVGRLIVRYGGSTYSAYLGTLLAGV